MKRQRGRGRKPGGGGGGHHHHNNNQPNRALESNGPDIKVRGPAAHIYERYLQLARDATASGDRVMGENYLQHAEHYFRMLRAMQPAMPPPPDRFSNETDYEGEDEGAAETEAAEMGAGGEGGDQPEAAYSQGPRQQPGQNVERENGDGSFRRRRGRRGNYRPDSERDVREGQAGEGEGAPAALDRPERRERVPSEDEGADRAASERRRREEREGPEGFSHGPKPAFLRTE